MTLAKQRQGCLLVQVLPTERTAAMSKVMKFIQTRSKSRGKQRQELRRESEEPLTLTSPRTVAFESNSVDELFRKAAFDQEPIIHFEQSNDDLDLTEEPSDADYQDTFYSEFQSSPNDYARSRSVTRPLRGEDFQQSRSPTRRRAKSTGRPERRGQIAVSTADRYEETQQPKKRKSKMEKIVQLQEKNQRYKDEFRKVQKDRKSLKRELENKKLETAALTKEIDTHITETSILKLKLSEALQQLDKTDQFERKDKSSISKLQRELSQAKGDYSSAVSRISRMREEVEKYKVSVQRKDDQIRHLSKQITDQSREIDDLHSKLIDSQNQSGNPDQDDIDELKSEKKKLEAELSSTLDRASNMVKEREDAIAELLRENDELKSKKLQGSDVQSGGVNENEIHALRAELEVSAKQLEETQDRNILLEDELEAWEKKGEYLEGEIRKLRDDSEAWRQKAEAAEDAMHVCEESAQESAKKANHLETALKEADELHEQQLRELEHKHTESILDLKEKAAQKFGEAEKAAASNPQDMMLQKAVAARKEKQAKGGWGSVLNRVVKNDGDSELTEEQKRIKELEAISGDQENDIKKLKSDMVKLKSTYNDTLYNNKKHIEQLELENQRYAATQKALELEIESLKRAQANFPDILDGKSTRSR